MYTAAADAAMIAPVRIHIIGATYPNSDLIMSQAKRLNTSHGQHAQKSGRVLLYRVNTYAIFVGDRLVRRPCCDAFISIRCVDFS